MRNHSVESIAVKAPQVLHQLIHHGKYIRALLADRHSFEALVPLVRDQLDSAPGASESIAYTICLYHLCREVNPSEFNSISGGLPLLMDLIKQSEPRAAAEDESRPFVLKLRPNHVCWFSTLLAFVHDKESLKKLTDLGLVELLVAKVVQHTDSCRAAASASAAIEDCVTAATPSGSSSGRVKRQYRTTSPSYQAVEMEYDRLFRYRQQQNDQTEPLNIFGRHDPAEGSLSPARTLSSPSSSSPRVGCWEWSDGETSSGGSLPPASPWQDDSSSVSSGSPGPSSPSSSSGGMSPLRPPALLSEYEESDGDEDGDTPGCYSPATFTPTDTEALPSSSPPPRKKNKPDRGRLCCEMDHKMLWRKLGKSNSKDYYENWPQFSEDDQAENVTANLPQNTAIYLLLKLSWLEETPAQLTRRSTIKAIIDHLVETPRPLFRACQILFRLARYSESFYYFAFLVLKKNNCVEFSFSSAGLACTSISSRRTFLWRSTLV